MSQLVFNTLSPLDMAVKTIVDGSHLGQNEYQYFHVLDVEQGLEKRVYPLLVPSTSVYGFDERKVSANFVVDLFVQAPKKIVCDLTHTTRQRQVASYINSYTRDLIEIGYWLCGKNELANGKTLFDYKLEKPSKIEIFYDFQSDRVVDDTSKLKSLLEDQDLIILRLSMFLSNSMNKMCCTRFTPTAVDQCDD